MIEHGVITEQAVTSSRARPVGPAEEPDGALEQRVRRLEDAVASMQDTRQMEERVAERLGAGAELPAPEDLSEAAEERARRKLDRLSRERDEMGPVNLRADVEMAELEGRIEGIARERDEIGAAIAKLRGGIAALNREGRARLSEAFGKVNAYFQELFTTLFGGGTAELTFV